MVAHRLSSPFDGFRKLGRRGASAPPVGPTVPAAITDLQWTLSDYPSVDGNKLTVDLDAAPADGGSALLYYEFRVDPGAWQLLPGGTALGPRQITVLPEAPAAVQLQAVNAVDATPDNPSDTKIETPTALAGPTNSVAPAITGIMAVGETATRSNGTWSPTPDEYETEWLYGASLVVGETAATYDIDDFTFGTVLGCRVRARQTGGAWSSWVNATGGGTVEANAQNVVWEADYISYDPSNPRVISATPAVTAGDMLVFIVKASSGSIALPFQQSDFSIGTLRGVSPNQDDGEAFALVTYVCPTTEPGGIAFSAGHRNAVELAFGVINIGPHIFSEAAFAAQNGTSAPFNFPALNAPRNGKVVYGAVSRNGAQLNLNPDPPNPATSPPYSEGGNFTDITVATLAYWVRTQATPGAVPTQAVTLGGYSFHKHFIASFTPQIVNPAPPAGKYIADSNGAGIAKTSTISSMVTDGVTINLGAARKVGNYITNNQGLGTLFAYDTGAGVQITSHTGSSMWVNPQTIIDSAGGQPFSSEVAANGPAYNAALLTTTPVTLYAGDVAVISVNQFPDVLQSFVSKFVYLHIVDTIPYDDEFAPPYLWHPSLGARPRFRWSDWNQGLRPLPTLAAQSNGPSLATASLNFSRRFSDFTNDWRNYNISATLHQPNYGTSLAFTEGDALAIIASDYTLAQKEPFIKGYVQRGIDVYGAYRSAKAQNPANIVFKSNGGQKYGRKLPIIFAGYLLGNNTMRDIATFADRVPADFQEDGMVTYVTQPLIDYTQAGGWPGGPYPANPQEAFVQGMLNGQSLAYPMPEWCGTRYDDAGAATLENFDAHWGSHPYRFSGNHSGCSHEVLLAAAMGFDTYWGNDAWFDYHRRHQSIERYGADPWILAGGGVSRYTMVGGAPGVGDRAPPSDSSGWTARMYWAHINTVWPYPW